jgi:hypothetical protein
MKNPLINLMLCLVLLSCTSKPKGSAETDSTKNAAMTTSSNSGPFDLARLVLNEKILDIMTAQGVKIEPKTSADKTLLGFEIFKTSNPKALRFENADLSGATGKNKNHVLFHYNEDKRTLAFYEVELYNQAQTDILINLLGKVGAITFKQTKLPKSALDLDKNGKAIAFPAGTRKTFRVWENKSTGISYFLIETGLGENVTTKLIVLKRSEQSGKDWVSYLSLDWYKDFKNE